MQSPRRVLCLGELGALSRRSVCAGQSNEERRSSGLEEPPRRTERVQSVTTGCRRRQTQVQVQAAVSCGWKNLFEAKQPSCLVHFLVQAPGEQVGEEGHVRLPCRLAAVGVCDRSNNLPEIEKNDLAWVVMPAESILAENNDGVAVRATGEAVGAVNADRRVRNALCLGLARPHLFTANNSFELARGNFPDSSSAVICVD